MTQLSSVLKKRRKELGLTLAQIADQMGVSEATVQRWESGNIKSVRWDKINKLAVVLHVEPSALMGWADVNKSQELATPSKASNQFDCSEILFALSKGGEKEITPEMFNEVKRFAAYVAQRDGK